MRTTKRAKLTLSEEELIKLTALSKSHTVAHREKLRSSILLKYIEGLSITQIALDLHTNRPLVERCIDKAIGYGAITALKDPPARGENPTKTDDPKSGVIPVPCQPPGDL